MEANLAALAEAVAAAVPERDAILWRDRRLTYASLNERTRRLANALLSRGLGLRKERAALGRWESGQDHVALLLYNCPEYLEGMLGAFKARLAPINVNYRYVAAELIALLRDARARAILFHASFAPVVSEIRAALPELEVLIQLEDESRNALVPGAIDYEALLGSASPDRPPVEWSPDDLYILYTGGTTGRPKGVLWRQADIFMAALGGRRPDGSEERSLEDLVASTQRGGLRYMPTAPLMHAAHWVAFDALHHGHTVVMQSNTRQLDPDDVLSTAERQGVNVLLIIGDAFARPLVEQLRKKTYDLSRLRVLGSGGAILDASVKQELLELLPERAKIIDTVGSSETGTQGSSLSRRGESAATAVFRMNPGACVLAEDLSRRLEPGEDQIGWFAQSGRVPLGYLGDREKTERTFPSVDGVRYSLPGDRARLKTDGTVELLGRDASTINSGGEKIFAEEVEQAIKQHPAVHDAVVCGRPSQRWGNEVAAVVRLRAGATASEEEILEECRRHLARYKLPRVIVFRDEIARSPSGKPDYAWARAQVTTSSD